MTSLPLKKAKEAAASAMPERAFRPIACVDEVAFTAFCYGRNGEKRVKSPLIGSGIPDLIGPVRAILPP